MDIIRREGNVLELRGEAHLSGSFHGFFMPFSSYHFISKHESIYLSIYLSRVWPRGLAVFYEYNSQIYKYI